MIIYRHRLAIRLAVILIAGFFNFGSTLVIAQDSQEIQEIQENPQIQEVQESPQQDAAENANISAAQRTIPIDEIVVRAERTFFTLRLQIEAAQDRMYSAYNDFNENDEFDVRCEKPNWTQTRIQERLCLPVFFVEQMSEEVQTAFILDDFSAISSMPRLARQEEERFNELRSNILNVADEHPQVLDALMEMVKLEEAYKRKQEECMEQQPILFLFRICR